MDDENKITFLDKEGLNRYVNNITTPFTGSSGTTTGKKVTFQLLFQAMKISF